MLKINFFIISIFFFITIIVESSEKVFISFYVDEKIVTNIDIKKESDYLQILNPQLTSLSIKKINQLAKKSLIKEIIKKKEIQKFINLEEKKSIENELLENLIKKLNMSNNEFENLLTQKNNYTIEEIKEKLKIEVYWNDLIYFKFNKQIKLDESKLLKKIENIANNEIKEYSLSEIIFEKNKDQSLSSLSDLINSSILEIGFENSANIYSISESSKFGGKIGWINENNLSKKIMNELKNKKKNEITNPIQIGNSFLILMVNDVRNKKISIDKEKELQKLIKFEQNKQLNQFSKIYFNKAQINYSINEK